MSAWILLVTEDRMHFPDGFFKKIILMKYNVELDFLKKILSGGDDEMRFEDLFFWRKNILEWGAFLR